LKTYDAKDIRNVLLVGHGGSGKTTLLEAMLYTSGAITRMGAVEDGNTVSDHDPDEQRKGISVSLSMAPVITPHSPAPWLPGAACSTRNSGYGVAR
jgi:elongation factor G